LAKFTSLVSATLDSGKKVRWIKKDEFPNGHKRGYVEFVHDKRQWKWGDGELIHLASRGSLFRMTPHPTKVVSDNLFDNQIIKAKIFSIASGCKLRQCY